MSRAKLFAQAALFIGGGFTSLAALLWLAVSFVAWDFTLPSLGGALGVLRALWAAAVLSALFIAIAEGGE